MIPVTPAFAEALRAPVTRPVLLFELLRENDALRIWNRYHTLDWAGHKWTGAGSVVSVSPLTETTELQVQRTILTFAAPEISEEAEKIILGGGIRRSPVTCWYGLLDESGKMIPGPIVRFRSRADAPTLRDDPETGERIVELPVEGAIFNLTRPPQTVLSAEDQRVRFPDDTGLDNMAMQAEAQLIWPTGAYNGFMPPA